MLQFFKKSGRSRDGQTIATASSAAKQSDGGADDDILSAAEKHCENENQTELHDSLQSNLSRSILQIVTNKNCLSYFVQFLDAHDALPPIKFWLDADSFRTAAAAELSLPGTPYSEEKHRFRTEHDGAHNAALPKATLSKSISLDMANLRSPAAAVIGNSFDHFHDDDSVSNCSLYEQCSLPDDDAGSCCNGYTQTPPSRCDSGASNLSGLDRTAKPSSDRTSDSNQRTSSMTDSVTSDMGRPLTDDEKSQLCEQNMLLMHKQQNLQLLDASSAVPVLQPPPTIMEDEVFNTLEESKPHTNTLSLTKPAKRPCFQSSLATDAIRIFKKYLTAKSIHHIEVPATILANISLTLGATECDIVAGEQTQTTEIGQIFVEAQAYILQTLERDHLNAFVESSFYCKYCVDILTGDALKMQDILSCDSALFYFMEFLEQEGQRHYLDFWLAAINFRKLLGSTDTGGDDVDVAQAQSDALVLYEKYFSLQATSSLRLSDRIRFAIEESICSTTVTAIAGCFDGAVLIVERYLDQKYLKPFLTSHLFYKYLSELLHRIDGPAAASGGLPTGQSITPSKTNRHRKTNSDCTHEKALQYRQSVPISSQNTLLAMESSGGTAKAKKIRSATTTDMQIDSRQMYNPDLLWRRKRPNSMGGLSFGRVDALGRYERDFDMEPVTAAASGSGYHGADGKATTVLATKGSRIRQVVRRLVNLPEERVQEDIAWQMAEMIVKDITSITLSGGGGGVGGGGDALGGQKKEPMSGT